MLVRFGRIRFLTMSLLHLSNYFEYLSSCCKIREALEISHYSLQFYSGSNRLTKTTCNSYLGKEYEYDPSSFLTKSTPSSSELEHVSQVQSLDQSSPSLLFLFNLSFFEFDFKTLLVSTPDFCISSFRDVRIFLISRSLASLSISWNQNCCFIYFFTHKARMQAFDNYILGHTLLSSFCLGSSK